MFAAQERRRPREELIERTPADGLVGGTATIDGAPAIVMSYDYTVLAGTQGMRNHQKKDRLFEIAERRRVPVVLFAEGGGGRPGDVDWPHVAGLDCRAFHLFAQLSGLVPLVGIAAGLLLRRQRRAARLLRRGDRHRGLEHRDGRSGDDRGRRPRRVRPERGRTDRRTGRERRGRPAGPRRARRRRGRQALPVVLRENRSRGRRTPAQRPGRAEGPDPRQPQARLRHSYGHRRPARRRARAPSWLRRRHRHRARAGRQRPAAGRDREQSAHLGGAIDADGADKAARFMQLCDAFGLPILFLCDTPGFMVGPGAEKTATVRHFSRLFVTGANLTVPTGTIVLRKGYGLGAQSMAGRQLQGATVHRRVADGGVRRNGPRGRGPPGHAPRARRDRGSRRTGARVRPSGRRRVRTGQGPEHGGVLRDRRRDRSCRQQALDRDAVRRRPPRRLADPATKRRPYVDAW